VSGIDGLGGVGAARGARRGGPIQGHSGFTLPADSDTASAQTAAADGPSPVQLDAMLTLQEMDPTTERERVARRHAQSMLAVLAALQTALLNGEAGDDPATLNRLASLLASMPATADPALAGLLAAVRLRTRIELARRGR
jgi:hypothetical protein